MVGIAAMVAAGHSIHLKLPQIAKLEIRHDKEPI